MAKTMVGQALSLANRWSAIEVADEIVCPTFPEARRTPATIGTVPGVYIAYPFCAQKCTFCNFASGVFPRELEARYLDALKGEVRAHAWQWTPETVYLGGGTPGNLALAGLREILESIPGRPWVEATIESAPGGLTAEKARAWAAWGIHRVSLGVQSFVEKEIRRAGRKHTAQTVVEELRLLESAGIGNVNIDLIAGLSGQTAASWRESLDWIERLAPPHVSVYMLEVDDDSRLGREMLRGGARYGASETPGEEQVVEFYETAVERLAALGTPRYEISNFARPGFESRHNLKYWKMEPYVGFGADAHSFDGRVRRQNPEMVSEYVERSGRREELTDESVCPTTLSEDVGACGGGVSACQPDTMARLAEERFFLGLRLTEGICPTPGEWRRFSVPIHRFLDAGLLETAGGVIRLTNRGVLFSNEVFREFINL